MTFFIYFIYFIYCYRFNFLLLLLVGLMVLGYILEFGSPFTYKAITIFPDYLDYPEVNDCSETLYEIKDGKLTALQEKKSKSGKNKTLHIGFLKVHKAGSTTIQNILFRFGMKHSLKIVLPKSLNYINEKKIPMPLKSAKYYDILAVHTTYSSELFGSLLPEDSVYIGIVREPIERFVSAAFYYCDVWHEQYLQKVPKANFIHNLIKDNEKYETEFFSHTKNSMARDFGINETKASDSMYIHKYLDELNSRFTLILTVEKFEESLVMMKRVLGWSISDILYLKTNSYGHEPIILSEFEKKKVKQTNFLDFEIYEYFSKIFNEKLKHVGHDFWKEVSFFKTVLHQVKIFCLQTNTSRNAKLVIRESNWDDEFKVSSSDCAWMKTEEMTFIPKLRKRHVVLGL